MKKDTPILIFSVSIASIVFLIIGLILGIKTGKITENKTFFSDEIILSSPAGDQNDISLRMEINRTQQTARLYQHHASYLFSLNGQTYEHQDVSVKSNSNISGSAILKNYSNRLDKDLSARETFDISLLMNGNKIEAHIYDLQGDFITKNRPEYTKYLSAGKAIVKINNEKYALNALLVRSYSSDSRKIPFASQFDKSYHTDYLTFWDKNNNFYLVDRTLVDNDNPNYPSHTWVLYKENSSSKTQKFYDAKIKYIQEKGRPSNWQVTIPNLNNISFDLAPYQILTEDYTGFLDGKTLFGGNDFPIHGFFIRYN